MHGWHHDSLPNNSNHNGMNYDPMWWLESVAINMMATEEEERVRDDDPSFSTHHGHPSLFHQHHLSLLHNHSLAGSLFLNAYRQVSAGRSSEDHHDHQHHDQHNGDDDHHMSRWQMNAGRNQDCEEENEAQEHARRMANFPLSADAMTTRTPRPATIKRILDAALMLLEEADDEEEASTTLHDESANRSVFSASGDDLTASTSSCTSPSSPHLLCFPQEVQEVPNEEEEDGHLFN